MTTLLEIVYVPLLNEGTSVSRPTQARHIDGNHYELLATSNYDPRDEEWEFLPGSIVRCERFDGHLKAIALVQAKKPTENK
jgi:hypothetical protein